MEHQHEDREPLWRRYARFFGVQQRADVHDELTFHLQSAVDELVRGGMTRDDAERAARERFGNVDHIESTLVSLSRQDAGSSCEGTNP